MNEALKQAIDAIRDGEVVETPNGPAIAVKNWPKPQLRGSQTMLQDEFERFERSLPPIQEG